jgi:hypothetical protein
MRKNSVDVQKFSYSLLSLMISSNASPQTFPSTEKVLRRAALTLLRRNHAARAAAGASRCDDKI